MAKHTPGPWGIRGNVNVFAGERAVANTAVRSTNGPDWEQVIEENEANARLIAAAPKLLESARRLVAYRDAAGPLNFQLEKADDFINELRAAIARAEGGE